MNEEDKARDMHGARAGVPRVVNLAYGIYNTLSKVQRNEQGESEVVRDEDLLRDLQAVGAQDLGGDVWRFDHTCRAPDPFTVTGKMEVHFMDDEMRNAFTKSAQLGFTPQKLQYALALAGFDVKLIDSPEFDAILAGLRLLAYERPRMQADDGIIDILTSAGAHDGLSAEEINDLGDRLQGG